METTVIGSYPKPIYLNLPDWFQIREDDSTVATNQFITNVDQTKLDNNINQSIEEVILEQKELGIHVITDGEIRRENYIYAFCRCLNGIDFENLNREKCTYGSVYQKLSYNCIKTNL